MKMNSGMRRRIAKGIYDAPMRSPALLLALVLALTGCAEVRSNDAALPAPAFDDAFWKHWGDNRAEIATYDLVIPRYGEQRKGVAVAIFVTETFSEELRVKADAGKHPEDDLLPVMKLNLVQDFPTGIYDYNLMTSAWVSLAPRRGRGAGAPVKVSFTGQEWCGHVYQHALFDRGGVRHVLHSYFDGEADAERTLDLPPSAVSEDTLPLWARGLAAPAVAPGESRKVSLLTSLRGSRLRHRPPGWSEATLSRGSSSRTRAVAAGSFDVETYTVADRAGSALWTFDVERAWPHRIVAWAGADGERAELVAAERLTYWRMNGEGQQDALGRLGLRPRPERTP